MQNLFFFLGGGGGGGGQVKCIMGNVEVAYRPNYSHFQNEANPSENESYLHENKIIFISIIASHIV